MLYPLLITATAKKDLDAYLHISVNPFLIVGSPPVIAILITPAFFNSSNILINSLEVNSSLFSTPELL